MGRRCRHGCTRKDGYKAVFPGCSESGKTGWCDPHAQIASTGWCNGAAWHPQDVGTLVAAYSNVGVGINELILDSGTWETALPATVEAVFYPKSCAYPREQRALECQGMARKTHREFLHKYDLTAEQVPWRICLCIHMNIDSDVQQTGR